MTVTKTHYHRTHRPVRPARGGRAAHGERGEGIISTAIAVLIMAFIGVAMWVAFNGTFQNTAKNVNNQVNCIGQSSGSC
ncbi:MAG: hypothetical protein ACRDYC_12905 [Acidimicrobiales bacterium]